MLTIPVSGSRIFLPVLLPVIGIAGAPFPRTVAADLAVFGIGGLGHLAIQYAKHMGLQVCAVDIDDGKLALIIGATTSLAVGFAADGLTALELRRLEDLLAVEATPFTHMGVVSSSQA